LRWHYQPELPPAAIDWRIRPPVGDAFQQFQRSFQSGARAGSPFGFGGRGGDRGGDRGERGERGDRGSSRGPRPQDRLWRLPDPKANRNPRQRGARLNAFARPLAMPSRVRLRLHWKKPAVRSSTPSASSKRTPKDRVSGCSPKTPLSDGNSIWSPARRALPQNPWAKVVTELSTSKTKHPPRTRASGGLL
jgi:hypothetical protein